MNRNRWPALLTGTSTAQLPRAQLQQHGFRVLPHTAIFDPPFSNRRNVADLIGSAVELLAKQMR